MIYDLVILTLKFDLLLKNFNHGFYLVIVAAHRASLSSDNSYWLLMRDHRCLIKSPRINLYVKIIHVEQEKANLLHGPIVIFPFQVCPICATMPWDTHCNISHSRCAPYVPQCHGTLIIIFPIPGVSHMCLIIIFPIPGVSHLCLNAVGRP